MGFYWLRFTGRSELQDLLPMVIVSLALKETEIRYPQVCQMEEQVHRDLLPNLKINTSIANSLSKFASISIFPIFQYAISSVGACLSAFSVCGEIQESHLIFRFGSLATALVEC